jgi:hypothetical protein
MTPQKLRNIIAEAVSLDRQIAEQQNRLDEIKTLLKTEAETRTEEHGPTDGGGWSWISEGADGCVVRVTQEGPKLKSSISTDKDLAKVKELVANERLFGQLFLPKVSYKPIESFRDAAEQLLGKAAAKLIKSITGKGSVRVSFETKEAA